jgi:enoyl-CoA hydratase/carnithine racemase
MLNVEKSGPVLRIALNRPEVRNAFNDELIAALFDAFSNLDPEIRVVVLSGEGKAFCAGGDLNWMRKAASYTEEQNRADALKLAELYEVMTQCRPLVVARLHGSVFGGGCGLAAAADYAVASEDALFAFSEVRLGLVPATISRVVIPKIGRSHARALFSTGAAFPAKRALSIGLVHEVVPSDELDEACSAVVSQILSVGPGAAHTSKLLAQEPIKSLEEGAALLARVRAGEEARQGIAAFLDRQPAPFAVKP